MWVVFDINTFEVFLKGTYDECNEWNNWYGDSMTDIEHESIFYQ